MVDETEFRAAFNELNELPCPFKKAIFSTVCGCSRNERLFIGDREAMSCKDILAQQRCLDLLERMREAAKFALKVTGVGGGLPHEKQMKVETGGMLGLQATLHPERADTGKVTDVYALIDEAEALYDGLDQLPYPEIIRAVAKYTPRAKRRSKRRRDS